MELILRIYEKKTIVKTYRAETYDLMFGTVEDLIELVDLDSLKSGSDAEILKMVAKVIINGMDIIKPLIKDIFDGLTDEELKKTKVSELSQVLVEVLKYSIAEMTKGVNAKN